MDVNAAMTAQRWPGAPTSPIVAAWPIELPHLQFQIHGSPDGVAAVHLLKVSTAHPLTSSHYTIQHLPGHSVFLPSCFCAYPPCSDATRRPFNPVHKTNMQAKRYLALTAGH